MTETLKGISVGVVNNEVHVRVVGRGTFQNSQPLRRYALEMLERGTKEFIVDLGTCDGMDSTFLGVLAGIGLRVAANGRAGHIRVANVSARNLELLQTLGLDRLFSMNESYAPPPSSTFHRLPDSDPMQLDKPLSKRDTAELMLECHENLAKADKRNVAKFKDLTTFLRDRVDKPNAEGDKKK